MPPHPAPPPRPNRSGPHPAADGAGPVGRAEPAPTEPPALLGLWVTTVTAGPARGCELLLIHGEAGLADLAHDRSTLDDAMAIARTPGRHDGARAEATTAGTLILDDRNVLVARAPGAPPRADSMAAAVDRLRRLATGPGHPTAPRFVVRYDGPDRLTIFEIEGPLPP